MEEKKIRMVVDKKEYIISRRKSNITKEIMTILNEKLKKD